MPYEYLDDVATADIAFVAWAETLGDTFTAAGDATMNVMVEELDSIQFKEQRQVRLDNSELDMLLFDFLQEFIYYKDSEELLLRVRQLQLQSRNGEQHHLEATMEGEKLDLDRHRMRVDVKAVTLHRFRLEKTNRGWEAEVILDI